MTLNKYFATTQNAGGLNRHGIRGILGQAILIIIGFAILFLAAGTVNWINGWVYVGLVLIMQVVSTIILARLNPQLLNERGSVVKKGTKGFDKVWLVIYPVLSYGNLVVMAFDAVRFQWSFMPFWLAIVGIVLIIPAFVIATWAMAVNKFFEWTVRIQDDRNHYVCMDGPYRIIRHPGYAGLIISLLMYPLILGSWWGFVLSGILTIVIITRTALEDRALQNELPGYKDYTRKARYRLIPFVW